MNEEQTGLPINVTGRHVDVTTPIKEYAIKKVEGLHFDYPKIIEARVVLDVENYRHIAEIILYCANHITIEASSETADLYASIDETINKIARQMRKHKTRLLRSHRPRKQALRQVEEQIYRAASFADIPEEAPEIDVPAVHREQLTIRPMFLDEAVFQLEISPNRSFLLFQNAKNDKISILYRRKDGEFGLIEPDSSMVAS